MIDMNVPKDDERSKLTVAEVRRLKATEHSHRMSRRMQMMVDIWDGYAVKSPDVAAKAHEAEDLARVMEILHDQLAEQPYIQKVVKASLGASARWARAKARRAKTTPPNPPSPS